MPRAQALVGLVPAQLGVEPVVVDDVVAVGAARRGLQER
jgi:hypothetical protein